jgi:O-acetyl-ADP-ribose deacetylase (regulator of RNase III)
VIHTVGPVWRGGDHGEGEMLARCYRNSFALATQRGVRTLAFPQISTGAYGFPVRQAAAIAVAQISAQMALHPDIKEVRCVCFNQECLVAVSEALA